MKFKRGQIPAFVVGVYGSARAFKALKRKQLRDAQKAIDTLGTGCAFFPCGNGPVVRADHALEEIEQAISAKAWGR